MAWKNKTAPVNLRAREKAHAALTLRLAGNSFDAIAAEVGYASRSGAYAAVRTLLQAQMADASESADELRKIELDRLDVMAAALWPKVKKGDNAAIDRYLRLQDRRAKYLGLDAPTKQELTGKDGEAIRIDARELLIGRIAGLVERATADNDTSKPE